VIGVPAGVGVGAGVGGAEGGDVVRRAAAVVGVAGGVGVGVGVGGAEGGSVDGRRAAELLSAPRALARPVVLRDGEGQVTFLERLDDEFPALWLYGAGHVGQALARILAELPLRLTWIDSRGELFPAVAPEGVRVRRDADSLATVSDAPPGAYFLVMTHSHPLDFALCQAILTRRDFAWLGLIGSASKAARFRSRLTRAGVDAATIGRLVCPIGVEGIESKWPAAIAVAVAAQVMQQISMVPQLEDAEQREGVQWRGGVHQREGEQNGARAPGAQESSVHARRAQGTDSQSRAALARTRAGSDDEVQPVRADEANCGVENCATCGTAGRDAGALTAEAVANGAPARGSAAPADVASARKGAAQGGVADSARAREGAVQGGADASAGADRVTHS
jgi:xanthine/CO dehydrogenase XdhC/CoxF family maturation factor